MVPLYQFPHRTITCLHMSHNIAVCSLYEDLLTSRAERASPKSHNFTPFLAVTSRFSDLMSLPPNTIPNCSASVNHHFTLLFDSSPYEEHCPCKHPHLQVMSKQEDKRQCLPVMLLYHSFRWREAQEGLRDFKGHTCAIHDMNACIEQPQAVAKLGASEPQVLMAHSGGSNPHTQQIRWQYTDLLNLRFPNLVL
jgi:hypothetical protein